MVDGTKQFGECNALHALQQLFSVVCDDPNTAFFENIILPIIYYAWITVQISY